MFCGLFLAGWVDDQSPNQCKVDLLFGVVSLYFVASDVPTKICVYTDTPKAFFSPTRFFVFTKKVIKKCPLKNFFINNSFTRLIKKWVMEDIVYTNNNKKTGPLSRVVSNPTYTWCTEYKKNPRSWFVFLFKLRLNYIPLANKKPPKNCWLSRVKKNWKKKHLEWFWR